MSFPLGGAIRGNTKLKVQRWAREEQQVSSFLSVALVLSLQGPIFVHRPKLNLSCVGCSTTKNPSNTVKLGGLASFA